MVASLETLVQKFVFDVDESGLVKLNSSLAKIKTQAKGIARAFNKMITPEQQVLLAKSNEIISHNNARIAEAKALSRQYSVEISKNTLEKTRNINATRLQTIEIDRKIIADKRNIQSSRERVAQIRAENRERLNAVKATKQQNGAMLLLRNTLGYFVGIHTVFGFFRTAREIDLAQKSIQGLTGTTQDFEYLTKEAFRTATAINTIAQSYKGFYAAANMSGFGKEQIQGMFSSVLTGMRGAGATPERVKGALLAIEQMMSKGSIQAQELRLQLGNTLPGAFELMASAANVTTAELDTMMRKGLLPAKKYVPLLIKELERYYKSGFLENAKSLDAAFINLGNATTMLVDTMMKTDLSKGLIEGIKSLTDLLRDKSFIALLAQIGNLIGFILAVSSKLLKFVSNHLPLVLILLGGAGLAGALLKIYNTSMLIRSAWFLLFNRQMVTAIGVITLSIKKLAMAIWATTKPFAKVYAWILLIMGLIIALQDIIYSLPFMAKMGFQGALGDYFGNMPTEGDVGSADRKIVKKKHKEWGHAPDMEKAKNQLEYITKNPITPLSDSLHGTMPTMHSQYELNKSSSISIGNVIINESPNGVVTWDNIVQSIQNVNNGVYT